MNATEISVAISVVLAAILLVKVFIRLNTASMQPNQKKNGVSGVVVFGWLLIVLALLGLGYFMVLFDVSVSVPAEAIGIRRVNNLGLMQDRQNGMISSCVGLMIGVLIVLFGGKRR